MTAAADNGRREPSQVRATAMMGERCVVPGALGARGSLPVGWHYRAEQGETQKNAEAMAGIGI